MYSKYFKRIFDVIFSGIALVVLSPVFVVIGIWLLFHNDRGVIFFRQERPGKNGKVFRIIKFKTMTDACDDFGHLLPDERRLTTTGKWIRELSIDELPQLLNVIKGDMSIIGPRPLLKQYLPLYTREQARRHELRPGITGWAQCHGRNEISWEEKFRHDIWYIDHCTLSTDVKIIWLTIQKVLTKQGISSINSATVEPFKGSQMDSKDDR